MRNMSFALTTRQFMSGEKDVTRRNGWDNLCLNEHFNGVKKAMGLKRGEKVVVLRECICISNTPEQVDEIIKRPYRTGSTRSEMEREGFPEMTAEDFVEFFCKTHKGVTPETYINRIEFKWC